MKLVITKGFIDIKLTFWHAARTFGPAVIEEVKVIFPCRGEGQGHVTFRISDND